MVNTLSGSVSAYRKEGQIGAIHFPPICQWWQKTSRTSITQIFLRHGAAK